MDILAWLVVGTTLGYGLACLMLVGSLEEKLDDAYDKGFKDGKYKVGGRQ